MEHQSFRGLSRGGRYFEDPQEAIAMHKGKSFRPGKRGGMSFSSWIILRGRCEPRINRGTGHECKKRPKSGGVRVVPVIPSRIGWPQIGTRQGKGKTLKKGSDSSQRSCQKHHVRRDVRGARKECAPAAEKDSAGRGKTLRRTLPRCSKKDQMRQVQHTNQRQKVVQWRKIYEKRLWSIKDGRLPRRVITGRGKRPTKNVKGA